jgi:Fic family protein
MVRYNWEQKDWPNFKYTTTGLEKTLAQIARNEGRYEGVVSMLPATLQASTVIDLMVMEAIKTSEIEGEFFSRKDVLSSIKKNLGVHQKAYKLTNKNAEGICKIMVDVRSTYAKPISKLKLCEWHSMLFAQTKEVLEIGKWRTHTEPMQVVSGAMGKRKVHFEAPASKHVPAEMKQFIEWFNNTAPNGKAPIHNNVLRAGIAHLYFLSIHPFEDGNGRIARAIAEKALSQGNGKPVLLSMSATIEANKKEYYNQLQKAQTNNKIDNWMQYFVKTVLDAQKLAEAELNFTLQKIKFLDKWKSQINARQYKAISKMLDTGSVGFEGGMNATKYGSINKISKATATRDLQELLSLKVFVILGGGRSTSYSLNL